MCSSIARVAIYYCLSAIVMISADLQATVDLGGSRAELSESEVKLMTTPDLKQRIESVESRVDLYEHRAEQEARDSQRLLSIDPGHSRYLNGHSDWLQKKADELKQELQLMRNELKHRSTN